MNSKDFNDVKNILSQMITSQECFINKIKENPKVFEWTIGQLRNNLNKSRELMSKQDSFLTNELYHLIGMGNLTAPQLSIVMKYTKEITSGRCFLKQISQLNTTDIFKFNTEDFNEVGKGSYKSDLFHLRFKEN